MPENNLIHIRFGFHKLNRNSMFNWYMTHTVLNVM